MYVHKYNIFILMRLSMHSGNSVLCFSQPNPAPLRHLQQVRHAKSYLMKIAIKCMYVCMYVNIEIEQY